MNSLRFLEAFRTGDWAIDVRRIPEAPELWQAEVLHHGRSRFAYHGARTSEEAREWAKAMIAQTGPVLQ